ICKELEKLGFKNRGVKIDSKLQFLNRTKDEALLIEYFFVDDKDDCNLYNKLGYKALAKAVVQGILNKSINDSADSNTSNSQGVTFKDGSYTGRRAKVIANELNVRYTRWIGNVSEPKVIGVLKQGQTVSLEWCEDGWISIQGFNGEKGLGYVNSKYLQLL
ncbi:MAG: SH3 domain-containing protein, partial [Paraclostridium sp.]